MAMIPADASTTAGVSRERFAIEDAGDDFPYYRGFPTALTPRQWLTVLVALGAGVTVLVRPWSSFSGPIGSWVQVLLFVGLPLGALMYVAGGGWATLLRGVRMRDVGWMLVFGVLNIVVSMLVGWLLSQLMDFTPNRAVEQLSHLSRDELGVALLRTLPQLFGEELMTVLPFLAFLSFMQARLNLGRRRAICGAWLLSSVLFGAVHLPTYEWNWVQCFIIIGIARLILTLAYIKTKNMWVSTGAHVVTDWSYFGVALLAAH